jgi:hypothetical protein
VQTTERLREVAVYHALRVSGRGGPFDARRSDEELDETGFRIGHSAIYMNESKWDGSDVFFIPGMGITLFVTERVAQAIRAAELTNVILTRNTECRYGTKMKYPYEPPPEP